MTEILYETDEFDVKFDMYVYLSNHHTMDYDNIRESYHVLVQS